MNWKHLNVSVEACFLYDESRVKTSTNCHFHSAKFTAKNENKFNHLVK